LKVPRGRTPHRLSPRTRPEHGGSVEVVRALALHPLAKFRPIRIKLRAEHLHRAITLRRESAEAEILAQRVVGDEWVESSAFPHNFLARGSENHSECSGFFIVERQALALLSKDSGRLNYPVYPKPFHCAA